MNPARFSSRLFLLAALLFSLFSLAPRTHAQTKLSVSADGLRIEAPPLAALQIGVPVLRDKDRKEIPLEKKSVGGELARFVYLDGTVLNVQADNAEKQFLFEYKRAPGATFIELSATLPFEWREGGRAALDADEKPFPHEHAGQMVVAGEASRLQITSPLGQVLALVLPRNWQQVQDNRTWNDNKSFGWSFHYSIERDPAKTRFALRVEDVARGAEPPKVLADRFGQTTLKEFPGKVKGEDELRADVEADRLYFAALKTPARDIWGGLPGSNAALKLKKTGFFHVEKIQIKGTLRPVLVDPDGNLFFQLGVCSLGGGGDTYTFVEGRPEAYEWLPKPGEAGGIYDAAYIDGRTSFSFYAANWARKHARAWDAEAHMEHTIARLRAWGFNSEGAFSGYTKAAEKASFPRVAFLPFDGMATIPDTRGLMDPFADGAEPKLDKLFADKVAGSNSEARLIGHFLGNEQGFEDVAKVVPGLGADSGAKRRLVQMLREKYADEARFNAAWQPREAAKSFDDLHGTRLFVQTEAAGADMAAFNELFLEAYFGTIARAYRKHCPNHLLLGSRWLSSSASNDQLVRIAGKYLDVVSINYYSSRIEKEFLDRIHRLSGERPILLSEWHFGTTEQGLSGGVKEVRDQRERGAVYRNYVEQAAALGYVVGHQWFSFLDQALTGRWFQKYNGERGNIGLVNAVDRPYKEFVSQAAATNADVYRVLLGERPPFKLDDPRFGGKNAAKPARKVLLVPHALPGMTIDGVMNNWPGLPAERIGADNLVLGVDTGGAGADFRAAWDEQNLYLFASIKDSTPMRNEHSGGNLWQGDGIEVFIGSRAPSEGGPLQFSDRQVLLSARRGLGDDDKFRFFIANAPQSEAQAAAEKKLHMVVVKNPAGDGYTVEAAIPFAALGFKPSANQELLFDLGFNDSGADGGRRQFMWNGVARNSGDRGAWGRARLEK